MSVELVLVCVFGVINIGLWFFFFIAFRSRYSPERILYQIRLEVDKLLIEISREADKDITLIEGRIKGLKALIEEADKRISVSQRETEKRKAEPQLYSALQRKTVSPQEPSSLFDTDNSPVTNKPAPIKNTAPVFTQAEWQIKPKIPIKEQIIQLHNTGFSAEMIAQRLSLAVGEVELTISLYQPFS